MGKTKSRYLCDIDDISAVVLSDKNISSIMSKKSSDYRKDAIKAAKDFGYGDEVIQKIKDAKNDYQISGIMQVARHEAMERDLKRGLI